MFKEIATPEELLKFMDNIKYGFVDKEGNKYFKAGDDIWYKKCYVQTGEEILKTMVGTCWDQVELERLWFSKNNYNFITIFARFIGDNDLPTHTFLIYEDNGKWHYFENAYNDYRGIYDFSSVYDAINFVKDKQLEYAIKYYNASKNDELECFKYDKLTNGLDVDNYLKHVTKKKIYEINIYDRDGNPTGKKICREASLVKLNPNEYIGIAVIFIENFNNEFLIQKTSKEKLSKNSSTGGHIEIGETPIDCIIRETKEELGLDLIKEELTCYDSIIQDYKLIYPFYIKKDVDINDLKLQKEEVDYVRYISRKELEKLIDEGNFSVTHSFVYNEVIRNKK